MKIVIGQKEHAKIISTIISISNENIKSEFNINKINTPKHPVFCKKELVLNNIALGYRYFIAFEGDAAIGTIAIQLGKRDTTISHLAVLKEYRNKGIGSKLLNYVFELLKVEGKSHVSLGLIDENIILMNWYKGFGFKKVKTKHFGKMPFSITFMRKDLLH